MDIKFPLAELKPEDFGQVQLLGFKDYYKNYFTELLYKVSHIIFLNYFYFRLVVKKNSYIY
jgi:hypothetical protein